MSEKPFHVVREGEERVETRDAELSRLQNELAARDRQETAISELGQAALTGVDPLILLGQACALVELTLQVSHCRALELTDAGPMLVRAALGANESFLGCTCDSDEDESLGMVTVLADAPFTFRGLEEETRFKATHLRDAHGVRSGAGVVIRTQYGPFGVILAYANEERTFAEYELAFLSSTANIVGEAITRARTEQALRKSEARLRQLVATTLDAVITVDDAMHVIEWNRQAEAVFGIASHDIVGVIFPPPLLPECPLPSIPHGRLIETVACRANGETFPIEITVAPAGRGIDATCTAFIRDISERQSAQRQLEERETRFRTIVEKSWSGVVLLDGKLRFSFAGSSTEHIIGYTERELLGRSLFEFIHPRELDAARAEFAESVKRPNHESHGRCASAARTERGCGWKASARTCCTSRASARWCSISATSRSGRKRKSSSSTTRTTTR